MSQNELMGAILIGFLRTGQEILLGDGVPEDELETELAPMAVQLAYVQQVLV